ncbi:MAG: glycosyltransferase [Bacteroidaceae bacterium]|nr:glycosyltransferase [Bacteroidaceae bacterium]
MSPLVSICVPIYNVAPYIERCARSLFEQDYKNIEYIFVNDGSTDDSMPRLEAVLATYPERQSMVHIYHNDHNHGLAYTRRISIKKATGEYIVCIDSDDWVDKNYISSLIQEAIASQADIVDAPYIEQYAGQQTYYPAYRHTASIFEDYLMDRVNHLWGKIIKRSLFLEHHCFAPEGLNYLEDRIALLHLCHYAQKISAISDSVYHYERQESSISFAKNDYHFECLISYWQETERWMQSWGIWQQYQLVCLQKQIDDKSCLMLRCTADARKKYADIFRDYEKQYIPTLTKGVRIMAYLVHWHLWTLANWYQKFVNWRDNRKK